MDRSQFSTGRADYLEPEGSVKDKKVVHTHFGSRSKFEIVRVEGWLRTKFVLYKDGKVDSGSFSTLRAAVEAAEKKG